MIIFHRRLIPRIPVLQTLVRLFLGLERLLRVLELRLERGDVVGVLGEGGFESRDVLSWTSVLGDGRVWEGSWGGG